MLDHSLGVNNVVLRYLLQGLNYAVFMGMVGYFSTSPPIRLIEANEAMITIAFAHAGQLREPCRTLSQEELMKLPPNMRKLDDCPRERSPIIIEAKLDGKTIYSKTMLPPGMFNDGGIDVFYNSKIPAGKHRFEIKMDDSVREPGFDRHFEQDIEINPQQIMLVGFNPLKGFVIN